MRRVAPGPGEWCSTADLHHGAELGLAASVRPLQVSCAAAMLRTHTWEAHLAGRIAWAITEQELLRARADTVQQVRAVHFRTWLDAHAPTVVRNAVREAGAQGVTAIAARKAITQVDVGPLTVPQARHFKARTQRWYAAQLQSHDGYYVEARLRHRLQRWRLEGFPGRNARCVASQLLRSKKLLPPRVRAAVLSTILNVGPWTDASGPSAAPTHLACSAAPQLRKTQWSITYAAQSAGAGRDRSSRGSSTNMALPTTSSRPQ